jgi:hypothetical protein
MHALGAIYPILLSELLNLLSYFGNPLALGNIHDDQLPESVETGPLNSSLRGVVAPRNRALFQLDSRAQAYRRWLQGNSLCSNDMVSDRVLNQLGVAFGIQDFLDSVLVESNGVRGYMQVMRHLRHRLPFSQQLQNWRSVSRCSSSINSLPWRDKTSTVSRAIAGVR